jgi:hypothetical protein
MKYSHTAVIDVIAFCVLLAGIYIWLHKRKVARAAAEGK